MSERSLLVSFASAISIAVFLYFQSGMLLRRFHQLVLGLLIAIIGTLTLPFFPIYSPAILFFWSALTFILYLLIKLISRGPLLSRQWWAILDSIGVASLLSATVYSVSNTILGLTAEERLGAVLAFYLASAACVHLFHELGRAKVLQRPTGLVFGQTLVLAAMSAACLGTQRIDFVVLLCFFTGAAIIGWRLRYFFGTSEEHLILEKMGAVGDVEQPEYTEPSQECPEPQLWSMYDPQSAEKEVLDSLYSLVRALKPRLVVETGTFSGLSSTYIAKAMKENGRGQLITCEIDPEIHRKAQERFHAAGLDTLIDARLGSSLDLKIDDEIDLFYSDSDLKSREAEVRQFLHKISPFGLILMHDAGSRFKIVREAALRMEKEGLISVVLVSTPRGLVIAQKRQGRV